MLKEFLVVSSAYGVLYSLFPRESFGFNHWIDPFYFSFTTMSTAGYGDLTPKTPISKALVMTQFIIIMAELVKFLSL